MAFYVSNAIFFLLKSRKLSPMIEICRLRNYRYRLWNAEPITAYDDNSERYAPQIILKEGVKAFLSVLDHVDDASLYAVLLLNDT